ncbi:transmembrane protein 269 [Nannospalax galili]|uniref:transmembrane protein 269 n=1 Tax=Nannospalax galili TaxID=1026970 RepID=UPI00111C1B57|nr:transmembrane protein 269 [Nannospalax galili]
MDPSVLLQLCLLQRTSCPLPTLRTLQQGPLCRAHAHCGAEHTPTVDVKKSGFKKSTRLTRMVKEGPSCETPPCPAPCCSQKDLETKAQSKVLEPLPCPRDCELRTRGQCTNFSPNDDQNISQTTEFSWKDVINALSLANMVLGLFSIFCSFSRKSHCASWILLVSFLLDMAVGAMNRHLNICHKLGSELNDFAVFTTFGLASALLLGVDGALNGFLAIIYVLTTSFRLCFYSVGGSLTFKGLPCSYASCVLASTSLLTRGNTFILCCMASLMILFMIDQSCYPQDEILESENWKKVVYMGGIFMLFFSPFSITAFYCLMWSLSYIFFPDALWGKAVCSKI